ncbi:MAG: PaaI family thioesterase [Pseudorhodoplanes sp.]
MSDFKPRNPEWEARVRESFARQPFMTLIGGKIEALKPGACHVALNMRPDLAQQRGFLHGGVTTALADTAAGFAAYSLMPPNSAPLTVELKINLMSPAVGETFVAEARVLRSGKTLTIVEVDVKAHGRAERERKLIARMLATMICIENTLDAPEEKRA